MQFADTIMLAVAVEVGYIECT